MIVSGPGQSLPLTIFVHSSGSFAGAMASSQRRPPKRLLQGRHFPTKAAAIGLVVLEHPGITAKRLPAASLLPQHLGHRPIDEEDSTPFLANDLDLVEYLLEEVFLLVLLGHVPLQEIEG